MIQKRIHVFEHNFYFIPTLTQSLRPNYYFMIDIDDLFSSQCLPVDH